MNAFLARFKHRLLKPLSLTARVYVAVLTIGLAVVVYFGHAWYVQERLAQIIYDILDQRVVVMHSADRLKQTMLTDQAALFHFLATQDPADLSRYQDLELAPDKEIEQLRRISSSAIVHQRLDLLQSEVRRYFSDADHLINFSEKQNLPAKTGLLGAAKWARGQGLARQQLNLLSGDSEMRLARINALCDELITLNQKELEDAQVEMNRTLSDGKRETLLAGVLVGLILLLVAVEHIRAVLIPLRALLRAVHRVEEGDLSTEIPIASQDEFGLLTQSFNRMMKRIDQQRERLVLETITDGLTGLYNQRHFRVLLKQEMDRSLRARTSFSLLMIDVDHFKQYNDSQGHESGNELLKKIAATLKETLRDIDAVARYGGDELAVILPDASSEEAKILAERIGKAVANAHFVGEENLPGASVTLSIGGATFPDHAASPADLVLRADEALYAAKRAGRDRLQWVDDRSAIPFKPDRRDAIVKIRP